MELDVSRIRAVCFDIDGTLRDTDDALAARLLPWLRPLGYFNRQFKPPNLARRIIMRIENPGNYLLGLHDRIGIDELLLSVSKLRKKEGSLRPGKHTIIPGVREMLSQLYLHFPLAVVSARGEMKTMEFLEMFEVRRFFTAIATGQTTRHTKPYPDPIIWAARQMGVEPEACLMVGDTTVDIRAGVAAGSQTVGVLCGFGEEGELRRAGASLILKDPTQLTEILLTKPLSD